MGVDLEQAALTSGRILDEVRELVRLRYRDGSAIQLKHDESPVTQADLQIETLLRRRLLEAFPRHGFRGEEFGLENESSRWVWAIDPIDGTRSFASGRPLFTTLVALLREGDPVLGQIDAPILDERWLGLEGQTTTLNGQPIAVRAPRALQDATLIVSRPGSFQGANRKILDRLQDACRWLFFEHDAYGYGQLARGDVDAIVERDLKPEDIAALLPIVQGAGGVMQHWDGSAPRLEGGGTLLAASCPQLANEVRALLAG